jgi:HK97 family phage prohead protease
VTSPEEETPRAPIEFRSSNVADVKFAQRIIDLIVVPYDEQGLVEYRGQLWKESFRRGAFDGIEKRPNRVRANRDHDDHRIVGKALKFHPSRQEGLVAEVRVSQTPLGDETLALADDGVLGASVGFAARGRDQEFDRKNMSRRINKAFVDHIAFVPDPTYLGAEVLGIRSATESPLAADLPKLVTPHLDELLVWLRSRSAADPQKPYGDVTYADPGYQDDKKKRYPLDTEAHCRAAWSYINQAKNAAQYTADQLAKIKARIKSAGKKYGIEFSDN